MRPGPFRVGVLASGSGTNLQAILGSLHGRGAVDVVAVGSDRPGARALERAAAADVPTRSFPRAEFADRAARDAAMVDWLRESEVELVVLAGYMQLVTPAFLDAFPDRVVNVHPALLPAFPGIHAIQQALDYGVKLFGVTVHFVDAGVDSGRIIAQASIELPDARTADEVHDALRPLEHGLLCDSVLRIARAEVRLDPEHPRRVLVDDPGADIVAPR